MSRRGPADGPPGRLSEFATYMTNKVAKLDDQFGAYAAAAAADAGTAGTRAGQLFRGVVIHVNGWTTPSAAVSVEVWECVCVREGPEEMRGDAARHSVFFVRAPP